MKTLVRLAIASALGVLPLALGGYGQTRTATFDTLYSFKGGGGGYADGAQPYAGLVAGKDALLYGTTAFGGTSGAGTVFKLTPPGASGGAWEERVLYNFTGGEHDGANPYGGLVFDSKGNLYGTTSAGGTVNAGTVFKLARPTHPQGLWRETVLHDFGALGDGATPKAGLTVGASGKMYGTTYYGGALNCTSSECGGTVFELVPPAAAGGQWTETVLHSFAAAGRPSGNPAGGVTIGPGGVLYGTTVHGAGVGTVFELQPPGTAGGAWTETILHFFGHGAGPAFPYGSLVLDEDGALYGTASGGAVFKLEPPAWSYSFYVLASGAEPYAGLAIGATGALFGTAYLGGASGMGNVFQVIPPTTPGGAWAEAVLHNFTGENGDGAEPYAGLVFGANGVLYGTTAGGGTAGWEPSLH